MVVGVLSSLLFVCLPHCAVGWSVVCDCVISWIYSLFNFSLLDDDILHDGNISIVDCYMAGENPVS